MLLSLSQVPAEGSVEGSQQGAPDHGGHHVCPVRIHYCHDNDEDDEDYEDIIH